MRQAGLRLGLPVRDVQIWLDRAVCPVLGVMGLGCGATATELDVVAEHCWQAQAWQLIASPGATRMPDKCRLSLIF